MKILLILSFLGLLNQPSENFKKLICAYEFKELSVKLTAKELRKGFKEIDKLDCLNALNPTHFWFTLIRNGHSSKTEIIEYKNRATIPDLLRGIQKGDLINFTIIINENYLKRRDKIIQII